MDTVKIRKNVEYMKIVKIDVIHDWLILVKIMK